MRTIIRLSVAAFVFAAFVSAAREALACTPSEYETPLCAIYWRAEIVFVAKVKAIDKEVSSEPEEDGVYAKVRKARLQVEEVMRGEVGDDVWAVLGNGADCRPEYEKGKRYLIYASGYDAAMGEIYTSRYGEITPDDGDYLESVRAFSKPKAEAHVLGKLFTESVKPMAGIEVMMESNGQSYSTTTDKEGNYSFTLKPGGDFKVSMIFPFSALTDGYSEIEYLAEEPASTTLGYGGTLQAGQCHYKELHVADVPKQK
jgi:hypothetical protein